MDRRSMSLYNILETLTDTDCSSLRTSSLLFFHTGTKPLSAFVIVHCCKLTAKKTYKTYITHLLISLIFVQELTTEIGLSTSERPIARTVSSTKLLKVIS